LYVITFYSFKGGVGRTMALVNVAAELVRRGRKVLVVDFDLEAPGLETYKHLQPPKPHSGIVEYVTEYRRTSQVPNLLDYIYQAKRIGKKGGRLWVMPAGRRDRSYRSALASLDWQRLYVEEDGFLLFEDTKKGWEEELKPDYVLIDSRTGDTDVLGICTRQLPDSVVLMFTPNEQNLTGLENVCRDIRHEETEGLKKTIQLHFVAANVPDLDDENGILRRQTQNFRERLGFEELSGVIRRYENLNLLDQSIFTLDRAHTRLARSYRRLLRRLLKDNLVDREGAFFFLKDYSKRHEARIPGEQGVYLSDEGLPLPTLTSPPPTAPSIPAAPSPITFRSLPVDSPENQTHGHLMVSIRGGRSGCCIAFWKDIYSLHRIAHSFKDDTEILNKVAGSFILEEDYRSAVRVFDRVLQLEPANMHSLWHRALCKTNLGDLDSAADDLLACLRLPDQSDNPFSMQAFLKSSCLGKLRDIAPSKLFQVAELLEAAELPGVDPELVATLLCDTEEGATRAIRLLRQTGRSVPVQTLLRARSWREVIRLHEAGEVEDKSTKSMFQLALAHWGESGEMPESLCREALGALESDENFVHIRGGWQAIALLLWRISNVTDALKCLERAEQWARVQTDDSFSSEKEEEIFSYWQLRGVSIGQYLDDCRLMRRMFQGEPIRPAFLGPASATTPL
jgi:MinD-like ATPase involved in chromosome partitioning or flagellar assembly